VYTVNLFLSERETEMTDHLLSIAQKYFDAQNRHEAQGIVDAFHEGGVYIDPFAQALTGEAIAAYVGQLWEAFPDLSFEPVGMTLAGNGAVSTQWLMKGTNTGPFHGQPPSGHCLKLPGAGFILIEGDKIQSAQVYFDTGEFLRQLGFQTMVLPYLPEPFRIGSVVALPSDNPSKPGAFSIASLQSRSKEDMERIRSYSSQIATELLRLPGFLGFTGLVIGDRFITIAAWQDVESARQMSRQGTHAQAMKSFFHSEIGTAGYTSIWIPERFNSIWVRCPQCDRMMNYEKTNSQCECGQILPEPPPYW
jgi:steroid delta-isomerase-like uncharacterized protein